MIPRAIAAGAALAGAALAGAAVALTAPARASAAPSPPPVPVYLGSQAGIWPAFHRAVPDARVVRMFDGAYITSPTQIPAAWPVLPGHPWILLSLRPMPGPLFSGVLDDPLRDLIMSAPPNSELTVWHEDAIGNNPLGYPRRVHDPATYRRMQRYMQRLVRGSHVSFGVLSGGPVNQAVPWLARGDGWYGWDIYWQTFFDGPGGHVSRALIWNRMTHDWRAVARASGQRCPLIRIGETNARQDMRRKAWFADVMAWFRYGVPASCRRPGWVMTFWRPIAVSHGGLGGGWPPSAPVRAYLRYLAREYA